MEYLLLDNILDAIFVLNKNMKIIYGNEAASILVGISQRRLEKNKSISEVIKVDNDKYFLIEDGKLLEMSTYKEMNYSTEKGSSGKALFLLQKQESEEAKNGYCYLIIREMTLEESLHSKYKAEIEQKEVVINELRSAQIELKDYSENLEKKVEERTLELNSANTFMNAMINSLEQGLFVFNESGECLPIFTKACERIYKQNPSGKKIWDVINLPIGKEEEVEYWSRNIFKSLIPYVDFVKLGPSNFVNSDGRYFELEYFPMKNEKGKLNGIVTVATDKTDELNAQAKAEKERKNAEMILKITKNRDHFFQFIADCKKLIRDLRISFKNISIENYNMDIEGVFRSIHSMKGGASMFSVLKLETIGHEFEDYLSMVRKKSKKEIISEIPKFKKFLEQLNEQLLISIDDCKVFLGDSIETGEKVVELSVDDLKNFSLRLENSFGDRSNIIVKEYNKIFLFRPIASLFSGYNDLVIDLSRRQNKSVSNIKFINGDLRVDPERFNEFIQSLVHVFRNIIYHGIEEVEERKIIGKDPEGCLEVIFKVEKAGKNSFLKISIKDDGRGIDPDVIRSKLKGSNSKSIESDHEVIQHIFDMGFSTSDSVDILAGRGVGMNAALQEVKELNGEIYVESQVGKWTRFFITIPFNDSDGVK